MSVNDQHRPAAGRPNRMRRARTTASAVAVLLVLAACNGDDDTTPSTQPPITSDTMFVTTTTEPTRSTSQAPTTMGDSSPSTSSATTSAPVTDPGSSTSAPDLSGDEQAVVEAARDAWSAYLEAIRNPGDEATLTALADTRRGDALDRTVAIVQELQAKDQRAVANSQLPTTFEPKADSVIIDGDTATVEYCWIGSDLLVEIGAGAAGGDLVVDDEIVVYVERDTFSFIDGKWRKTDGVNLQRIEDEVACDGLV